MNSAQRELFRQALLRVLEINNTRYGLGAQALSLLVNQFGFSPRSEQVETELSYLEDKNLVACINKRISPENRMWRITADGRDFIAQQ